MPASRHFSRTSLRAWAVSAMIGMRRCGPAAIGQRLRHRLDLADAPGRLDAVHDRHLAIHQNEVEFLLREEADGDLAVGRGDDATAHHFEDAGGDLLIDGIVLGDEDARAEIGLIGMRLAAQTWRHARAGRLRRDRDQGVEELRRPHRLGQDSGGVEALEAAVRPDRCRCRRAG